MKNLISNIRNGAAGGIILLFFSIQIIAIIGSLLFPDHFRYLNPANIAVLLKSMAPLGIMSLGVGILMISGEFDLSVGTLYTFCGIITASLVGGGLSVQGAGTESVYQMSPYLATLCGVAVGVMILTKRIVVIPLLRSKSNTGIPIRYPIVRATLVMPVIPLP